MLKKKVCVCACVRAHVHVHGCMHACMYVLMHAHNTYICICMNICACKSVYNALVVKGLGHRRSQIPRIWPRERQQAAGGPCRSQLPLPGPPEVDQGRGQGSRGRGAARNTPSQAPCCRWRGGGSGRRWRRRSCGWRGAGTAEGGAERRCSQAGEAPSRQDAAEEGTTDAEDDACCQEGSFAEGDMARN